MKKRWNKAQTALIYAVLIAVVAAALITMKIYLDRAFQAKFRQAADVFGQGEQYAKGITTVDESGSSFTAPDADHPDYTCLEAQNHVKALEEDINTFDYTYYNIKGQLQHVAGLRGLADSLEAAAKNITLHSSTLGAGTSGPAGMSLGELAKNYQKQATQIRNAEIPQKQAEIERYKTTYPECFQSP